MKPRHILTIAALAIMAYSMTSGAVIVSQTNYTTTPSVSVVLFSPKPGDQSPAFLFHLQPTLKVEVGQTQNPYIGGIAVDPKTGFVRKFVTSEAVGSTSVFKAVAPFGSVWTNEQDGFMGFEIKNRATGVTNYAWHKLRWNEDGSFYFGDAGYETKEATSIITGMVPRLTIAPRDYNSVTVTWNAVSAGYRLQHSPDMTVWTDHPETITMAGNIVWPIGISQQSFFRLKFP